VVLVAVMVVVSFFEGKKSTNILNSDKYALTTSVRESLDFTALEEQLLDVEVAVVAVVVVVVTFFEGKEINKQSNSEKYALTTSDRESLLVLNTFMSSSSDSLSTIIPVGVSLRRISTPSKYLSGSESIF
jgi:uncharacterized protein (DUF1330 family)